MLRGLTTISFWAVDLQAAREWYTEVLGIVPYFERPGYIEFRLGDYQHELGIIDSRYAPTGATTPPTGTVVYWHVDDIKAAYERLLTLGAVPYEPIIERGEGFITASVVDPFGNILGIMYNVHYLAVLAARPTVEPPVLELVHFRVKPGVRDEQVLAASAETQTWLEKVPGYLAREVSKNEEGQWIDLVHWRTLADAQAAAQLIMQEPCAANFMALLDPEQMTMVHVARKQYFGRTE
jgi:predicted enzyme related to lactoylglutathione lyase